MASTTTRRHAHVRGQLGTQLTVGPGQRVQHLGIAGSLANRHESGLSVFARRLGGHVLVETSEDILDIEEVTHRQTPLKALDVSEGRAPFFVYADRTTDEPQQARVEQLGTLILGEAQALAEPTREQRRPDAGLRRRSNSEVGGNGDGPKDLGELDRGVRHTRGCNGLEIPSPIVKRVPPIASACVGTKAALARLVEDIRVVVSPETGAHTASTWCASLLPAKGVEGVDARRPPRREVTREQRDRGEKGRNDAVGRDVSRVDTEERT